MSQTAGLPSTLGHVLNAVGATLFEGVLGDTTPERPITGVVIYDAADDPIPQGALVLGVGLHDPTAIEAVLTELASTAAAGLVVREPIATLEPLVDTGGVPVLALTRGASWSQVAAVLRSATTERDESATSELSVGGIPLGDLFGAANAVAALVDEPVTIEDRSARVLAFSGRQDEADLSRVESILGRQVPEGTLRTHTSKGVFRELYASTEPIWVPGRPDTSQTLGRMVMAVRAGGEVLGSIWVASSDPLSPDRTQALSDVAPLVALHLLHHRIGENAARQARTSLVQNAIEAGPKAPEAIARLGLDRRRLAVVGLSATAEAAAPTRGPRHSEVGESAATTAERHRIADAFAVHLDVVVPGSATALVGDTSYALVPVQVETEGQEALVRVGEEFLRRISSPLDVVIGIGTTASGAPEIGRSREAAERVLRVLRLPQATRQVATLDAVQTPSLLIELADRQEARGEGAPAFLTRLLDHDAAREGHLLETLAAWLDAFGDVNAAAAAVFVHPNTFRYRLRRVGVVSGLDLNDPEDRFAAMLHVRLLRIRGDWPTG